MRMKTTDERGVALITAVLMLGLMSALLIGVTALAMSEQRSRFQNRDRTQAFEAAHSGLEKLTNDLGSLFSLTYAPTDAQIATLKTQMPTFPGVKYDLPGGAAGSGYQIVKKATEKRTLTTGAFSGLTALVTPYEATVTAKTPASSEVSLRRTMNTVAIPVFQFGIFSETDLSYFPGPDFNFGGRVHTNGGLYLAKGGSAPTSTTNQLILADRVTAVREIYRQNLANGHPTSTNYQNPVRVLAADGGCDDITSPDCRPLAMTEGSWVNGAINPSWTTISNTTYASHIMNGRTGATTLNLPLTGDNATPVDLIRRPTSSNEDTANPSLFGQRFFQYASLRVLLSDSKTDITNLPTVTSGDPVDLSTLGPNGTYPARPNIARSPGSTDPLYTNYAVPADTPTIKGFIKIEKQKSDRTWEDVTDAILGLGIGGRRLDASCAEVNPNAIIRLQRIRYGNTAETDYDNCGIRKTTSSSSLPPATVNGSRYFPNVLFDAREGVRRDSTSAYSNSSLRLGGAIYYVELDIANLRTWLNAQSNIMKETGYVFYFSDRRGNHSTSAITGNETGEYGFEDVVNRDNQDGARNNTLDTGEDVNDDTTLDTYGFTPKADYLTFVGTTAPLDNTATADTGVSRQVIERNPAILFRRGLKLVHGNRTQMYTGAPLGLTVAAENPVYIEGDYNAITSETNTYDQNHVACAVIADAVTLLSVSWNDGTSLTYPYTPSNRQAQPTTYRTAIISGKSMTFQKPTWSPVKDDFGTDGGTHNFLRYLEDWGSRNIYYRGSMVSFFYSRQATGVFKCCDNVYGAPTRIYTFDDEFLDPDLLPPRTPMVRDINTTGFSKLPAPPSP